MNRHTKYVTLGALFMALGILFPVVFHAIGLGSVFLPMFWPIAACGFFLPFSHAISVGCLTPIISSMATGMPPAPTLYRMIFELATLAASVNLIHRKTRLGTTWTIAIGLLAALPVGLLGSVALALIVHIPPRLYAILSLVKEIPGIMCILLIVPFFVNRMKQETIMTVRQKDVPSS